VDCAAATAKVGAVVYAVVGAVAIADEPTVMVWEAVFVLLPSAFVAVRVAV
jgi:hypothetical protein